MRAFASFASLRLCAFAGKLPWCCLKDFPQRRKDAKEGTEDREQVTALARAIKNDETDEGASG